MPCTAPTKSSRKRSRSLTARTATMVEPTARVASTTTNSESKIARAAKPRGRLIARLRWLGWQKDKGDRGQARCRLRDMEKALGRQGGGKTTILLPEIPGVK